MPDSDEPFLLPRFEIGVQTLLSAPLQYRQHHRWPGWLVWIKEHPDFDIEKERAEAKKVAQAMMDNGWEFASHTWGHLHIRDVGIERLQRDTTKWLENVAPLIGGTDTIIFSPAT